MKISIITPTYNRAHTLPRCFESLMKQNYDDFEWIIVDDGSTDDTQKLVESMIKNSKFKIKYLYQKNQGKHIAHNLAVSNAEGELTVCVDSDDYLVESTLSRISTYWNENKDEIYIGIVAKRGDNQLNPICSKLPQIKSCTMYQLTHTYNVVGDTVLFYKTDLLKKELFKRFSKEKFLAECSLYFLLDSYGEMLIIDEVMYIGEYLDDGLTKKFHKLLIDNPKGSAYCYRVYYDNSKGFNKIKYAILYNAYRSLIDDSNEKAKDSDFLIKITRLLGYIYMRKHNKRGKNEKI